MDINTSSSKWKTSSRGWGSWRRDLVPCVNQEQTSLSLNWVSLEYANFLVHNSKWCAYTAFFLSIHAIRYSVSWDSTHLSNWLYHKPSSSPIRSFYTHALNDLRVTTLRECESQTMHGNTPPYLPNSNSLSKTIGRVITNETVQKSVR